MILVLIRRFQYWLLQQRSRLLNRYQWSSYRSAPLTRDGWVLWVEEGGQRVYRRRC